MLDICDVFSKEYFVKYNANKTVAICYGKSGGKPKRSLRLDGECIRWETSVKYLGNIHCSSMNNHDDIKYKKRIYISSVNKLNCQISFASSWTRAKLLQTYCSAWYGSQNAYPGKLQLRFLSSITWYDTRFVYYSIYAFSIENKPWTVLAFAYVFSGVFAEYAFSIVFAVCVFSIEMWLSIL